MYFTLLATSLNVVLHAVLHMHVDVHEHENERYDFRVS